MKICFICAIYILSGSISYNLSAQVPQSLNYQAVARNINGNALPNKTLGLRISIHDSIASGNIIYKETFSATTNKLGLFTLNIGTGTPVSGIFAAINWGKSNKFLQVEMDTSGGTNYTDLGTTQLLSVPYALYAAKAGNTLNAGNGISLVGDTIRGNYEAGTGLTLTGSKFNSVLTESGKDIYNNNPGNFGIGTTTPAYLLDVNGKSHFSGHLHLGDTSESDYPNRGISYSEHINLNDNLERFGILSIPFYAKTTSAFTNPAEAIIGRSFLDSSNTQDFTYTLGLVGVEGAIRTSKGSSGTISNIIGLLSRSEISNKGANVINRHGLHVQNSTALSGEGIPTHLANNYGIYIDNQTGGSLLNYSIYSEGGANYFGGATTISSNTSSLSVERTGVTNTRYSAVNINGNHNSSSDGSNLGVGISFNMANNLNNSTYANVAAIQGVMLSSSSGAETGELQFYTKKSTSGIGASDVRMTIDNNGKVGIGKLPAYNLDVSGPIDADSVMIGGKTILNSIGTNNTSLGYNANTGTGGFSNSTAIGYAATTASSNTMAFGNSSVTTWAFGRSTVSNSAYALQVGSGSSNGNGAYLTTGGSWTNASDRNKKENFKELNGKEILNRICELSITQWNYKGENIANTHIGPMAQDFYKEFHTGGDSLAISTIDPAGVALVGLQEMKKENEALKMEVEKLKLENEKLKTTTDKLSDQVAEINDLLKNNTSIQTNKSGDVVSQK